MKSGCVLGGLRLNFVGGSDVGHEADVHEHDVFRTELMAQLAYGLDERLTFDVADGSAYLRDDDVRASLRRRSEDALFDGVGDVGDDLDRSAEEIAPPLARHE